MKIFIRTEFAAKLATIAFAAATLFCLTLPELHAQNAQGTVLGHVTDATGAPVEGAKLSLINTQTNITQTARSNSVGDYVFVNLNPGIYTLKAELKGFKTQQASNLHVGIDQTLRQDFKLSVIGDQSLDNNSIIPLSGRGQVHLR